jgi:hypothetical protein
MSCYVSLKNTWENPTSYKKLNAIEKFFMTYALRGSMVNKETGVRMDIPVNHPIFGPVKEPSPLNTRWKYSPREPTVGVL